MNLYEILDIPKDADKETIKKAHRKKAKKHHPDMGGNEKTFYAITLAYQVLSDDKRRKKYDQTGETAEQTTSIKGKAINILAEKFNTLLDEAKTEIFQIDVVASLQRSVNEDMARFKETKKKVRSELIHLYKVRKRLVKKSAAGEDPLLLILNRKKQACVQVLVATNENFLIVKEILAMLEDYEFIYDKLTHYSVITNYTSTTTGNW